MELRKAAEGVTLEVRDDGRGFNCPTSLGSLVREGRYGLAGAQERMSSIGGRLDLESRSGHGTVVRAAVPWGGGSRNAPIPEGREIDVRAKDGKETLSEELFQGSLPKSSSGELSTQPSAIAYSTASTRVSTPSFPKNTPNVILHGLLRDFQRLCNAFVPTPHRHQPKHLRLALC